MISAMNPYARVLFITALVASGTYAFVALAVAGDLVAMAAIAVLAVGMFYIIGGIRPAYYIIWGFCAVLSLFIYMITGEPASFGVAPAAAIYLTLKFIVLFGDRR